MILNGAKIPNYTQHNEALCVRSGLEHRAYCIHSATNVSFILQTIKSETCGTKPESRACVWVYMDVPVLVRVSVCRTVFVCSGKSGVWILSGCLSDRKPSSV